MPKITRSVNIRAPLEKVFSFYDDPGNLRRITPPNIRISILKKPNFLEEGSSIIVRVKRWRFDFTWSAVITKYRRNEIFIDEQQKGPFRVWKHTHLFDDIPTGTKLTDIIEYELPWGILGEVADQIFIRREIQKMLKFRQEKTKEILEKTSSA